MSNIFNGINTGLRGLQAQQKSLEVTGHNIANANNEEYTRQRVIQTATRPHPFPSLNSPGGAGQIGTGVKVDEIERVMDQFINEQIWEESQDEGYWKKIAEGLQRIEYTFNEPSDSSLNNALSNFWQSLQDLSNHPEDSATRAAVRQRGRVVVDTFHTLHNQLMEYKQSLNFDVDSTVKEINTLSERIADLNKQIVAIESSGQKANDLKDKRDGLFSKMSKLVNVRAQEDQLGSMHVALGGIGIVSGSDYRELETINPEGEEDKFEDLIVFKENQEEARIESGELKGIVDIRDEEIDTYIDFLDNMAQGLHDRFNEVHSYGFDLEGNQHLDIDGEPDNFFFNIPEEADNASLAIELDDSIIDEDGLNLIAAGNYSDQPGVVSVINPEGNNSFAQYKVLVEENTAGEDDYQYTILDDMGEIIDNGEINGGEELELDDLIFEFHDTGEANISLMGSPGSGANATALANVIKEDSLPVLEGTSIENYYEALISTLGVNGQRANQMVDNQEALVSQLEMQKESVSGVSLDEEMANIIKYQQAYNAASKIIVRTDRMLDILMDTVR